MTSSIIMSLLMINVPYDRAKEAFYNQGIDEIRDYTKALQRTEFELTSDSPIRLERMLSRRGRIYDEQFLQHDRPRTFMNETLDNFPENVFCTNKHYSFRISKKNPKDEFTIRYIGPIDPTLRDWLYEKYNRSILAPVSLRDRLLLDWLKTPGFSIKKLEHNKIESQECVALHVAYDNNIAEPRENYELPFSGKVYLNPSRRWGIVRADLVLQYRTKDHATKSRPYIMECYYDGVVNEFPAPKTVRHIYPPDAAFNSSTDYKWYINHLQSASGEYAKFSVSAYGLPEYYGLQAEKVTPWWIYFGLIGGGCLVGFVLIGVFLRRRYGAS